MTIKWELNLGDLATALVALVAVLVAWRQLHAMVLQTRANTLLALDQRWESEPLVSLRADLLRLIETVTQRAREQWPGLSEAERRSRSAELYAAELQNMRANDRYLRLFQICGFFETVGHVARSNYIPASDIINLLGGSILQTGMVFKPHIDKLHREEGADVRQYEHFLWLVNETRRVAEGWMG